MIFFCCYGIHLWRHEVDWDYDIIADVDNDRGECILSIGVRFIYVMSASIHVLFSRIFLIILYSMLYLTNSFHVYYLELYLDYVPALTYRSRRVSDQGTTLRD